MYLYLLLSIYLSICLSVYLHTYAHARTLEADATEMATTASLVLLLRVGIVPVAADIADGSHSHLHERKP